MALALATGAVLGLGYGTGVDNVGHVFARFEPAWIALVVAGQVLALPAYMLAYRSVATVGGGEPPPAGFLRRVVVAGFGPFTIRGGFDLDRLAARARSGDGDRNVGAVVAIALLEWIVLAPIACAAAIVLLSREAPIEASLLWPWAIGVPVGLILAAAVSTAGRARVSRMPIARAAWAARTLDGLQMVRTMIAHPRTYAGAWIGTGAYWAVSIAGFYGAVRAFGLKPGLGSAVIAYGTGYIGTRRSLPLGGAGVTEVLLVFALYWVNQPLAPALGAVVVYRGVDYALTLAPGLLAYGSLHRRVQSRA